MLWRTKNWDMHQNMQQITPTKSLTSHTISKSKTSAKVYLWQTLYSCITITSKTCHIPKFFLHLWLRRCVTFYNNSYSILWQRMPEYEAKTMAITGLQTHKSEENRNGVFSPYQLKQLGKWFSSHQKTVKWSN